MIKLTMTGTVPGPDTLKIETEDGQLIPLGDIAAIDVAIRPGCISQIVVTMNADVVMLEGEQKLPLLSDLTPVSVIDQHLDQHYEAISKAREDKEPDIAKWHRWCTTDVIKEPES